MCLSKRLTFCVNLNNGVFKMNHVKNIGKAIKNSKTFAKSTLTAITIDCGVSAKAKRSQDKMVNILWNEGHTWQSMVSPKTKDKDGQFVNPISDEQWTALKYAMGAGLNPRAVGYLTRSAKTLTDSQKLAKSKLITDIGSKMQDYKVQLVRKENQIENGGNTPKKTFEEGITHACDTLLTRIEKTQKASCDLIELSEAIRKVKAIASKKVDVSF